MNGEWPWMANVIIDASLDQHESTSNGSLAQLHQLRARLGFQLPHDLYWAFPPRGAPRGWGGPRLWGASEGGEDQQHPFVALRIRSLGVPIMPCRYQQISHDSPDLFRIQRQFFATKTSSLCGHMGGTGMSLWRSFMSKDWSTQLEILVQCLSLRDSGFRCSLLTPSCLDICFNSSSQQRSLPADWGVHQIVLDGSETGESAEATTMTDFNTMVKPKTDLESPGLCPLRERRSTRVVSHQP